MALMCGGLLKCLRNGFSMLEMTSDFDKWLIYVGNYINIWETAKICVK